MKTICQVKKYVSKNYKIADKLNFVEAKYTVNKSSSMYFNTLVILILRNIEDLLVIYAS